MEHHVRTVNTYSDKCSICGHVYVDNTEVAVRGYVQRCEAQGKNESVFKFRIGDVLLFYRFNIAQGCRVPLTGRIVSFGFEKKTHEPIYNLAETSSYSLQGRTSVPVNHTAEGGLKRVPAVVKMDPIYVYMCLRCRKDFRSTNEYRAQELAEQCEEHCREVGTLVLAEDQTKWRV